MSTSEPQTFRLAERNLTALEAREEHFLLKVVDPALAETLRKCIDQEVPCSTGAGCPSHNSTGTMNNEEASAKTADESDLINAGDLKLRFTSQKEGMLILKNEEWDVRVQTCPTALESYKTLDDTHCIKISDINQMLLVGKNLNQNLNGDDDDESKDGLTPPMKSVRQRVFAPKPEYTPEDVASVEQDLIAIFDGYAPPGCQFVDREEKCVKENGKLIWKPM